MESEKRRYNPRQSHQRSGKIDDVIIDIQEKLRTDIKPTNIIDLNAFERKQIHSFFDNKPNYKTKTYRGDNDDFTLRVYPIGNLKKFTEEKAQEALKTGATIQLPAMTSYERFVIHEHLKAWEGIETASFGEGEDRHIEISPKRFGRTLKRIIKRIKRM